MHLLLPHEKLAMHPLAERTSIDADHGHDESRGVRVARHLGADTAPAQSSLRRSAFGPLAGGWVDAWAAGHLVHLRECFDDRHQQVVQRTLGHVGERPCEQHHHKGEAQQDSAGSLHWSGRCALGQLGPVVPPVGRAEFAPVNAGGGLNRDALVCRSASTAPVANGLRGFAKHLGEYGCPANDPDRALDACFGCDGVGSVHRHNVHDTCTRSQRPVLPSIHNSFMEADHVWVRIDAELTRRKDKHLTPGSWAALGKLIAASRQTMTNWKKRGVPPKEYAEIAIRLGWTVDQLLGHEELPAAGIAAAAPETEAPPLRDLSARLAQLMTDIATTPPHLRLQALINAEAAVWDVRTRTRADAEGMQQGSKLASKPSPRHPGDEGTRPR